MSAVLDWSIYSSDPDRLTGSVPLVTEMSHDVSGGMCLFAKPIWLETSLTMDHDDTHTLANN